MSDWDGAVCQHVSELQLAWGRAINTRLAPFTCEDRRLNIPARTAER